MLLPSAFPCDGSILHSPVIHTQSASTYGSPTMASRHRRTISSDIFTTCRALQNRLSANMAQSSFCASRAPTLLPSPTLSLSANIPSAKSLGAKQPSKKPSSKIRITVETRDTILQEPLRGTKKRRRSVSDDEARDSTTGEASNAPSTPKRQRMAPLSLPLGLQREDFEDLSQSPPADRALCDRSPNAFPASAVKPSGRVKTSPRAQSTLSPSTYSTSLATLILGKLSLREEAFKDFESSTGDMDDRWRSWIAAAEMARGRRIRREMVIRRGGRRERKGLDGIW